MSKVVQSAIRSSHYGNCKYCRNKSTSYCEECEHYDHEYYDYWESIAPEEMAQMEKEEELESAVKNAVTKYILVHIPDDFKRAFDNIRRCAPPIHHRANFMGVFMTNDGCMAASDSYMLCEIRCDSIPKSLRGHIVITLEDGRAGINDREIYPPYRFLLDTIGHSRKPLDQAILEQCTDEIVWLQLEDRSIAVNRGKLELIKEILSGEITLYFKPGENTKPVILTGENGIAALAPILRV